MAQLNAIEAKYDDIKKEQEQIRQDVTSAIEILGEALPKQFKTNVNRILLDRIKKDRQNVEQALEAIEKIQKEHNGKVRSKDH